MAQGPTNQLAFSAAERANTAAVPPCSAVQLPKTVQRTAACTKGTASTQAAVAAAAAPTVDAVYQERQVTAVGTQPQRVRQARLGPLQQQDVQLEVSHHLGVCHRACSQRGGAVPERSKAVKRGQGLAPRATLTASRAAAEAWGGWQAAALRLEHAARGGGRSRAARGRQRQRCMHTGRESAAPVSRPCAASPLPRGRACKRLWLVQTCPRDPPPRPPATMGSGCRRRAAAHSTRACRLRGSSHRMRSDTRVGSRSTAMAAGVQPGRSDYRLGSSDPKIEPAAHMQQQSVH